MKQLILSLFRRDNEKPHSFLRETKPNRKLWNEMLKEKDS